MCRCGGKVGVSVHAFIDHQVTGQHLAIHTLSTGAGAGDGLSCLNAGHMHHVNRHAQHVSYGNGTVGRFGLDHRWP